MPPVAKIWHLLPHDRSAIERLGSALEVSPILAQLLLNRGVNEPVAARRFLKAPLADLHPPALLPGVGEAAERLFQAATHGRRICVYGDYDVDGITGTVMLWQVLRLIGGTVDFYVPHRLEEGYGLSSAALRQIAGQGTAVVVTVDCGIGSVEEVDEARRLGLELIITDHHQPREQLPPAAVLVHPDLPGQKYPCRSLSGAGVAFKLAWALSQRACGSDKVTSKFREFLLDSVALAALGLVADVVPLLDENRVLARHGLARLCRAPSLGLKALLEATGLAAKPSLCADDIAFRLAPRLNAVGRLGCARLVVDLLTTTSTQRAAELARYLEEQNQQRQQLERRMFQQARERVERDGLDGIPALVIADLDWHAGIIGIVAGRLAERYARPALLIALGRPQADGATVGQGSGRSVPGFPLHEALHACGDLLLSHGGHAAAAGFKIRPEAIDAFRQRFCDFTARYFPTGLPVSRLAIDAEVPLGLLTLRLLADLDQLEPYGMENRRPLFLAGGLQLAGEPQAVGQPDHHLSFRVRQGATTLRAIAFNLADRKEELMSAGGHCCLVFRPRLNEWKGLRRVDLEVHDFQAGPEARLG